MTVGELIQYLQDYCEGSEEVRLAHQPSYPLQFHLGQPELVELYEDCDHIEDCEDDDCPCDCGAHGCAEAEAQVVLYLPEAGDIYDTPYLPGEAARALGWSNR